MKNFERNPTVESIDTDLLTQHTRAVGGIAPTGRHRRLVSIPRNSIENSLRKLVKKFRCDLPVGSIDTDLLTRCYNAVGGMALTGRRPRVVPIPRNYIENSLRKLVRKFERDPTVGSIDTDLLTHHSHVVGGIASTGRR